MIPFRARIGKAATGRVVDVGIGSGLNLPFYGEQVERIVGVDPSAELLGFAEERGRKTANSVELLRGFGEALPIEDRSIDTAVLTFTLCTVDNVSATLLEIRRVLRPDGRLLFAEHGRAPEAGVARWQDRLTPLWRRIAGGCHLNRKRDDLMRAMGFRIDRLETRYIKGPPNLTCSGLVCAEGVDGCNDQDFRSSIRHGCHSGWHHRHFGDGSVAAPPSSGGGTSASELGPGRTLGRVERARCFHSPADYDDSKGPWGGRDRLGVPLCHRDCLCRALPRDPEVRLRLRSDSRFRAGVCACAAHCTLVHHAAGAWTRLHGGTHAKAPAVRAINISVHAIFGLGLYLGAVAWLASAT